MVSSNITVNKKSQSVQAGQQDCSEERTSENQSQHQDSLTTASYHLNLFAAADVESRRFALVTHCGIVWRSEFFNNDPFFRKNSPQSARFAVAHKAVWLLNKVVELLEKTLVVNLELAVSPLPKKNPLNPPPSLHQLEQQALNNGIILLISLVPPEANLAVHHLDKTEVTPWEGGFRGFNSLLFAISHLQHQAEDWEPPSTHPALANRVSEVDS